MKVFLTGGTGYIGRRFVRQLVRDGHTCVTLSRADADPWSDRRARVIQGDSTKPGEWQREISGADAVVNLAGARLVDPPQRWTASRKKIIHRSRIATTERVADAIRDAAEPPRVFLSGSAVGYYGDRGDEELTEDAAAGDDFLAALCVDWEAAAEVPPTTRLVTLRTGLVLGRDSPVLSPMLPVFKLGLGGPWGSGRQWWPWVHLADVLGLMRFAIEHDVTGPMNLAAPHSVRVNEFARALGAALKRPAVARVPGFLIKWGLGELADALLASQHVVPGRALAAGYEFRYPDLEQAFAHVFAKT